MGARGFALFCLVMIFSKFAFGQEVVLPKNALFLDYLNNEKQIEQEKIEVFIPLTIQPTNSQSGIYQQILTHQLHQMESYGLPTQRLKQWDGRLNIKSASSSRDPTGTMTFQVQPLTQQGSINFQNIGRVSIQHQIFLNQTEYRLTPYRSRWSFSHVDTLQDSQNRLFYGWEW